jgi:hypothetical protein
MGWDAGVTNTHTHTPGPFPPPLFPSAESIADLTELVVSKFSRVPNKDVSVMQWPDTPYTPDQLKVRPVDAITCAMHCPWLSSARTTQI